MTDHLSTVYLDNAATSFPKPDVVGRAMSDYLATRAVNPGRSGFDLSLVAGQEVDDLRARLDRLFGNPAADPDRVVFTSNATGALNLALNGLCRPGDHVVATVLEHNSVLRPLTMLARAGVIDFDLAPCDAIGFVDPTAVERLLNKRTRLVVMNHGSNVVGTLQDVAAVGRICRERGVTFVVDAAQTAGLVPVDMASLGADLVAFTGHKSLLGPTGTGGLVVGPGVDLRRTVWGGTGVRSEMLEHPAEYPWRLEAGTLNTVGLAGLAAAIGWLDDRDPRKILEAELDLTRRFIDGCANIDGLSIQGPSDVDALRRLPVVSLTARNRDPARIGMFLDADWNVAVRTGLQCAPMAHQALGTAPEGSVRVSFGPFNTGEDVERILEGLARILHE